MISKSGRVRPTSSKQQLKSKFPIGASAVNRFQRTLATSGDRGGYSAGVIQSFPARDAECSRFLFSIGGAVVSGVHREDIFLRAPDDEREQIFLCYFLRFSSLARAPLDSARKDTQC